MRAIFAILSVTVFTFYYALSSALAAIGLQ